MSLSIINILKSNLLDKIFNVFFINKFKSPVKVSFCIYKLKLNDIVIKTLSVNFLINIFRETKNFYILC